MRARSFRTAFASCAIVAALAAAPSMAQDTPPPVVDAPVVDPLAPKELNDPLPPSAMPHPRPPHAAPSPRGTPEGMGNEIDFSKTPGDDDPSDGVNEPGRNPVPGLPRPGPGATPP